MNENTLMLSITKTRSTVIIYIQMGGYVYVYIGNSRNCCSNWDAEILQQHKQLMSKVAEHKPWTYSFLYGSSL